MTAEAGATSSRRRTQERFDARHGSVGISHVQRLLIQVLDPHGRVRRAHGQHRDVGIELLTRTDHLLRQPLHAEIRCPRLGTWQHGVESSGPGHVHFRRHEVLHRLLGLDPRTAAAGPAWTCVERDRQPQAFGFLDSMAEQLTPGALMNATGPRGMPTSTSMMIIPPIPAAFIASKSAVMPSTQVAVHDHQVHPRPRRIWRRSERLLQIGRRTFTARAQDNTDDESPRCGHPVDSGLALGL